MAAVGQLFRLERQRQPLARTRTSSASTTTGTARPAAGSPRATSGRRSATTPTTSLLVVPHPDGGRARSSRCWSTGDAARPRLLPHRVLLPVGDELGRDHGAVAVPVLADRRGQQAPVVLRRQRAELVQRPARASSTSSSARSASTSRRPRLAEHAFLGVSWWDWLAGPSVAMSAFIIMAVFTTSGTFMLLFLAALQNLDERVNEAARAGRRDRWRVPAHHPADDEADPVHRAHPRPDRLLAGLRPDLHRHAGAPGKTTLTPAFLSYNDVVQQPASGASGRGHRVHPVRDHRGLHARPALGPARNARPRADAASAQADSQHDGGDARRAPHRDCSRSDRDDDPAASGARRATRRGSRRARPHRRRTALSTRPRSRSRSSTSSRS